MGNVYLLGRVSGAGERAQGEIPSSQMVTAKPACCCARSPGCAAARRDALERGRSTWISWGLLVVGVDERGQ